MSQKGFVHLLPLLVIALVIIAAFVFFLISRGIIENPAPEVLKVPTAAKVDLKAEYKNPLDKSAQYTNPFASYKNPFDALK